MPVPVKLCERHPMIVYYDGKYCPCCKALRQLNWQTRKKVFAVGGVDKFRDVR